MMNTFLDNVKVYKWLLLLETKRQTFSETIPDVSCFSIFHAKLSEKPSWLHTKQTCTPCFLSHAVRPLHMHTYLKDTT